MAKTNTLVEIKDIHKSFGPLEVLKGVDFSVSEDAPSLHQPARARGQRHD